MSRKHKGVKLLGVANKNVGFAIATHNYGHYDMKHNGANLSTILTDLMCML